MDLEYKDIIKAASYNPLIIFKYKSDSNNPNFINDIHSVFPLASGKEAKFETQVAQVKSFMIFLLTNII